MSYMALYRKFRPDTFEDVKGQDHIVTTMKNQIKAQRIGHAYLFCGTRGTGKTTVAKILAKTVNCEHPVDGNPCNTCAMCQAIQAQSSMNVIEIDAASNNGVDNIREIVEEVKYSPTEGKYKVYIIDEVHMLSAGAFNALLKTLEEPPSYVIFILATTEVHKIPITILSRCQRYDFRRITVDEIAKRLKELTDKEAIEAEEKALRYVARAADGSLRDALSLLDQCIAFYLGQTLTYDNVLEALGTVDIEVFARLLRYIRKGSVTDCIELLEELIVQGRELTQFTIDFTWYLRNLLLAKTSEDMEDILEMSSDQLLLLKQEANSCDAELLIRFIRIFSELSNQVKYATQKRVLIEVALVKLCKPAMEADYNSLIHRIKVLEKRLEDGVVVTASEDRQTKNNTIEAPVKEVAPMELPKAVSADLQEVARNWNAILRVMPPLVRTVLISAKVVPGEGNTMILVFEKEVDEGVINQEAHLNEIKNAIADTIGKEVLVQTKVINDGDALEACPDLTKIIKKVPIEYVD